jgi:hypothetical protein
MDNWLETLIGTVIIGGIVGVTAHQYKKKGYNEALDQIAQNNRDEEIRKLREELNDLKSKPQGKV